MFKQIYFIQWNTWASLFNIVLHFIISTEGEFATFRNMIIVFPINYFKFLKGSLERKKKRGLLINLSHQKSSFWSREAGMWK